MGVAGRLPLWHLVEIQTGNSEQGMHSMLFTGIDACIKRDLLTRLSARPGSLDARASD